MGFRGAASSVARKQAAVNRRLFRRNRVTAGFLGIERKFYDTGLAATSLVAGTDQSGGEVDPSATSMVSTPAVGDTEQNRDGKQISCLYLQINGSLALGAQEAVVDPIGGTMAFVAVVLDTQTNGAQMNSEDCFKNTIASATLTANPMRNLLFGTRFRILKERMFNLDPKTIAQNAANDYSWQGVRKYFKWFIPLGGLKINFNSGTTASVANVIDNSIHIIAFTNNTAGVPAISYNARLRFVG